MIRHSRLLDAVAYLLLTLGLVFALGPLYMAVCSATVSNSQLFTHGLAVVPGDQLLENLQQVTRRLDLLRLLGNSLLVATLVVIGKLTLSALTAFAVVYFRSRYTSVIFFAVLGALLLPLEVRIIPTYAVASDLFGPLRTVLRWLGIQWLPVPTINLLDSYTGLALPLIASATGTFLFRQFYQTLPAELVEAARMDGAGPWRFFIDILLPLSKTNFAALGTLVFIGAWKDYLWPLVATNREDMRTLVLGVASFLPTDASQVPEWNLLMAAAVVSMLPPILVIALMQRWFVKGLIGVGK
ncbi:ABC transporter permease subunit [Pseudomonas syringae]|uniref:sn-glycerol-3-phosphate transport system permease protein UgpE n=4 Tax=Pseudomonas syringae TaxID=317 RepID=A0A3M4KGX3_PSESF|nr:ABC transporter permease subunit [Pseudomonas syringae]EPM51815.1 glycerol-3-phosphate ABC transporter permease [Pseudomonas syringae pv. actinidiae ICMP 19098]EPN29141.1 glycerol-3-phosphate ABC transporter permease [Pseudomonas syringae pv. actinidiae ICMP 19099]EPN37362.1 glycerol-3-phosphate ABC transporter permease [Pseudomonas syringae pv. actinidiae ICMP 18883]EPN46088.1 glycerol-3-phosphate ABC transporter permease [Pseudomonas syringae pv. actinidiae ICMP 19095]EPN48213.1 glycerol-